MDVRLYQTVDGGEIDISNGQLALSDGLETAVYLSLFGGNEDDSGGDDTERKQWWGNFEELDEDEKYRSETQYLLNGLPASSANLLRIEDAIARDLAWLSNGLASSVDVAVSIPALNRIAISIEIVIDDREFSYVFTEAWRLKNQ